MTARRFAAIDGLTAAVVVAFLAVLGSFLGRPGYTPTRLAFSAVLGGLAVAGAAGVVRRRELVAAAAAGGLLLLGFWQAVLWIHVFPVVAVLAVAAVLVSNRERANTA